MIDLAYYLTGRDRDFACPALNHGARPWDLNKGEEAEAFRRILFPGREDYYVLAAITALATDRTILLSTGLDLPPPFLLHNLQHGQPTWQGAAPDFSSRYPSLKYHPDKLPADFEMRFSILSPGRLQVWNDSFSEVVPFSSLGDAIYPAWPRESGLSGGVIPHKDDFSCSFSPVSYPWAWVADALKDSLVVRAISRNGYADAYASADNPAVRVAAAVAALYALSSDVQT